MKLMGTILSAVMIYFGINNIVNGNYFLSLQCFGAATLLYFVNFFI